MPRIRMLTSVAGDRFSYGPREVVDVDATLAQQWCANGLAELVRGEEPEQPERSAAKAETTSSRSRASRARKSS